MRVDPDTASGGARDRFPSTQLWRIEAGAGAGLPNEALERDFFQRFDPAKAGIPHRVRAYATKLVAGARADRDLEANRALDEHLRVARRVGAALVSARLCGVPHRDVKPRDVMVGTLLGLVFACGVATAPVK